jgi:pyruvate/2-oxoglutarate dehydrogenase complex dihydrolipoamide dehydrogenase (E3) component
VPGYLGLELAETLTLRGLRVTQVEMLLEVISSVDPELGRLVRARLAGAGVDVVTGTRIRSISQAPASAGGRLQQAGTAFSGHARRPPRARVA